MSEETKYVHTIFKSNLITFDTKEDDCRYAKSTQEIEEGTILFMEHCYGNEYLERLT